MPSFPHDATFKPGEREALEASLRPSTGGDSTPLQEAWRPIGRGSKIIKEHTCPVTYPDGLSGFCRYERQAPTFHRFRFTDKRGQVVATIWHSERLPSAVEAIEKKAAESLSAAFAEIIERERKEYFARASEYPGRNKRPERFQMSTERAKEVGGKYAICVPMGETGERLIPVTETFETLEAANQAWREKGDARLVVACGNRLDRCWEKPKRNTLYKEFPDMAPSSGAA